MGFQPQISNYLVWSIITTVCCCLIPGIIAIVKSSEVNTRLAAGDFAGAKNASDMARNLNIIGMVLGGLGILAYIIIVFLFGVGRWSTMSTP